MTVDDYLNLPYHITLVPDQWEDGTPGWFATVEEFPGCMSQGATPDEAVERVRDAMAGWITIAQEDGKPIPEPRTEASYSGKLLLRMPRSLHAELARRAETEGVSLNQLLVANLALVAGMRASEAEATAA